MPEENEEVFDIDALLDSVAEDDYKPTAKTSSHFVMASEVIADLKKTASYPFVGPCKLDTRQRWGLRMNLVKIVRTLPSSRVCLMILCKCSCNDLRS